MTKLIKMFLYPLNFKNRNKGITLIELLVVFFVIGLLAAIALPVFLKQVNKAIEAEATYKIDYLIKQQNAYYHEENIFTDSLNDIGYSSKSQTENYVYKIMLFPRESPTLAAHFALSKNPSFSSYVGALYLKDKSTYPQLCKPFSIPNTPIHVTYLITDQELLSLYYSRSDWESFCK